MFPSIRKLSTLHCPPSDVNGSREGAGDLKSKLGQEGFELYEKIVQLQLPAEDGW